MQVLSIFRLHFFTLPPLHQWPKSIKRVMLAIATALCIGIYVLLFAGLISFLAIMFDFLFFRF